MEPIRFGNEKKVSEIVLHLLRLGLFYLLAETTKSNAQNTKPDQAKKLLHCTPIGPKITVIIQSTNKCS